MIKSAVRTVLGAALLCGAVGSATGTAHAAKRHVVVTAVEPKGGANVEKEAFPTTPLPEGGGYIMKKPDDKGRWEEGDEVALEFVGINGTNHPVTIEAYGQTFELKRGHVHSATFTADKPGRHSIICSAHTPTMLSELIVAPKK